MTKVKIIFLAVFVLALSLVAYSAVLAAENVNGATTTSVNEGVTATDLGVSAPTVLPTSPWYFLKDWWRGVKLGLTWDPVKKEEVRLQQMNERLLEVQDLFNQPVDEKTQQKITQVLEKYQSESEKFKAAAEELKAKVENNEALSNMMQKYTDWELKRQYLLEQMSTEEQVKAEMKNQLQESMTNSLNSFVTVSGIVSQPQEIEENLGNAIKQANGLRKMYSLQVLEKVAAQVPAVAKPVIEKVQTEARDSIRQSLETFDEITKENLMNDFIGLEPSETTTNEIKEVFQMPWQNKIPQAVSQPQSSVETPKELIQ